MTPPLFAFARSIQVSLLGGTAVEPCAEVSLWMGVCFVAANARAIDPTPAPNRTVARVAREEEEEEDAEADGARAEVMARR